MGNSSKGCNSFIDMMNRVVRNPFKDGMMGRTYEEFLIHYHIQPEYRIYSENYSESYFFTSSIGQGPTIWCPETVEVDWWNPRSE